MLKPEVYNTLSDIAFEPPVKPGQHPVIPEGSSEPQAASIRKEHKEKFSQFLTYD